MNDKEEGTDKEEETKPDEWDIFYERYGKYYSNAFAFKVKIAKRFKEAWKDIAPSVCKEIEGGIINVDEYGYPTAQ